MPATPSPGEAANKDGMATIILTTKIFDLIKEGKVSEVMTFKEFPQGKPDQLKVALPGGDELLLKVTNMHRCFHGYRPEGYPENEASRGRSTVFGVEIIHAKTNTDGPLDDQR